VIEVVRTGALLTVQDHGRFGYGHLGVPRSGAADLVSFRLANRLVGNSESAASLEVTLGGAAIRFHAPCGVAVTGAPAPVTLDGSPAPLERWCYVQAGQLLELGVPALGLRSYVAIAGGVDSPPVLGSRSTDTLSGIGPAALRPGDRLALGRGAVGAVASPDVVVSTVPAEPEVALRYRPGPRDDWFPPEATGHLETVTWELTSSSNRVGARLSGPAVPLGDSPQIQSEGMVLGAIQVPPSGQPIVFLADHPPTGGYPVIGVVDELDVARLAQTRPGQRLRFVRVRGR
jgi:biotin-dependent carboxylase-like uncharacterized protein